MNEQRSAEPGDERKAVGPCRVTGVKMRKERHLHAVYATVLVEDANGEPFFFDVAAFNFDLKPLVKP